MSAADRLAPREFAAGVHVIAARELGAYFDSSIAYVFLVTSSLLANFVFTNRFFLEGHAEMTAFFELMPPLLAVFLPAVTMRLWAEESKQRTLELLLTLPIRPLQAVLGKFLAAYGLFAAFVAGSLPIVAMLAVLGDPDGGRLLAGYLGLALLGALFLAAGMFLSAFSGDQIVAFVLTALLGAFLVLTGLERIVAVLDGLAPALGVGSLLYESVAVLPRYESFVRGLVDLSAVLYFVLGTAAFLWANALVLERRRA